MQTGTSTPFWTKSSAASTRTLELSCAYSLQSEQRRLSEAGKRESRFLFHDAILYLPSHAGTNILDQNFASYSPQLTGDWASFIRSASGEYKRAVLRVLYLHNSSE